MKYEDSRGDHSSGSGACEHHRPGRRKEREAEKTSVRQMEPEGTRAKWKTHTHISDGATAHGWNAEARPANGDTLEAAQRAHLSAVRSIPESGKRVAHAAANGRSR
jgi:hypothetical protein